MRIKWVRNQGNYDINFFEKFRFFKNWMYLCMPFLVYHWQNMLTQNSIYNINTVGVDRYNL